MKILIFEYITGGGLSAQALPDSLCREGALMLQTLVKELIGQPSIELVITLDKRCLDLIEPKPNLEIITIDKPLNFMDFLPALIAKVDAVWPIAPETDACLTNIARLIRQQNKLALISSDEALQQCSDKLLTAQVLCQQQIPTVPTQLLSNKLPEGLQVIKPRDGCGCQATMIIDQPHNLPKDKHHYISQTYIAGISTSLSALFKNGQVWLVCRNQQQIEIVDHQFSLKGCLVNIGHDQHYQRLLEQLATALPGLWGYIGIDLLETASETLVLEINPRLTSSYVGIAQATGINVAQQVLALLNGEPNVSALNKVCVKVDLGFGNN